MSRTRYRFYEDNYAYFMTSTINGWLPVFTRQDTADIILNSWRHLQQEKRLILLGYVIIENHVHWIARCEDIASQVRNFKSFTARSIVSFLEQKQIRTLLDQLRFRKARHKTQSRYQVWQEGDHPKQIQGDEMMWQKLEYIHLNPVKRGYVDEPLHWRWSSARNYAGQGGLIDVCVDW